MKLTVVAKSKAKPGQEQKLEQALRAAVRETHKEAGCLSYALHHSIQDPSQFVLVERWTSKEALDAHFTTAHFKALIAATPGFVAEEPEVLILSDLPEGQPDKGQL